MSSGHYSVFDWILQIPMLSPSQRFVLAIGGNLFAHPVYPAGGWQKALYLWPKPLSYTKNENIYAVVLRRFKSVRFLGETTEYKVNRRPRKDGQRLSGQKHPVVNIRVEQHT